MNLKQFDLYGWNALKGRAAYMDFWPFRALPWAKTSAPQGVPTIQIATFSVV